MVYFLLLCFAATNSAFQVEQKINQELPVWSMDSVLSENLTNQVEGGWFEMRLPMQYGQVELDTAAYEKADIKVAAWTKETGRAIKSTVTIMLLPTQKIGVGNDKDLFDGILESLIKRWPDARGKGIVRGKWNGRPAYRFEFTASDKKDKVKGVVYAVISPAGNFVVSTMHPVGTTEDQVAFKILEQVALSCKQK